MLDVVVDMTKREGNLKRVDTRVHGDVEQDSDQIGLGSRDLIQAVGSLVCSRGSAVVGVNIGVRVIRGSFHVDKRVGRGDKLWDKEIGRVEEKVH